ncbi:MAG: molybdopterin converting factor subunit 1 [Deltaproteobacteria bacterium]|nr:MAG: molybdopterin converting factor subunit 1 [Deltaproteobacteria bacterium]
MGSMRVTMLYFAAARERAGVSTETLELPEGATAAQALSLACERHPALQAVVTKLRVAVDQDFAQPDRKLRDGSEVALIPPVSGGVGSSNRIGPEALSAEAPLHEVTGTDCGAVVTFVGTVRSSNHGKAVVRLEYEAYPEMALRVFDHICAEARERWGARLVIHHRTGSLDPGALSVVIAAAAPHRADAFEACRHAIELLKKEAPIWKREIYPDGSSWVGLGS